MTAQGSAMQKPVISVIIPAFNAGRYIVDALDSAQQQTFTAIEIIVVDDCSTDNTVLLVEEAMKNDSRICLIKLNENGGVAKARNIAIDKAQGDWIAFLDSDDIWEREKLEKQLIVAAREEADLVCCSYDCIDETGISLNRGCSVPHLVTYNQMLSVNSIGCSSVLLSASIARSAHFPEDFYHEDYLLWMRLLGTGIKAVGLDETLMHYRICKGSRSANKLLAAKNRWRIYRQGLGMGRLSSLFAFVRYGLAGIRKYYL